MARKSAQAQHAVDHGPSTRSRARAQGREGPRGARVGAGLRVGGARRAVRLTEAREHAALALEEVGEVVLAQLELSAEATARPCRYFCSLNFN